MSDLPEITRREDCTYRMDVPTRWNDNDMLGHVNNVMYYSYFEAIVVRFLMQEGGLDWKNDPILPLAVETLCKFRRSLSYPDMVEAGLRVIKVGTSSATYAVGLFTEGDEKPAALGHFVHVYVDRESNKSAPIPQRFRDMYQRYL